MNRSGEEKIEENKNVNGNLKETPVPWSGKKEETMISVVLVAHRGCR